MNTPITLSLIIALFGLLLTVLSILDKLDVFKTRLNAPEKRQNERLDEHDLRLNEHDNKFKHYDECLHNDDRRIKTIQQGYIVMVQSLQALLSDNTEEKQIAYKTLNDYLRDRITDSNI